MKYINVDEIGIITFPDSIDHSIMFKLISNIKPNASIVGAGKIGGQGDELVPDYLYCYGESVTLSCRCAKEKDNLELKRSLKLF